MTISDAERIRALVAENDGLKFALTQAGYTRDCQAAIIAGQAPIQSEVYKVFADAAQGTGFMRVSIEGIEHIPHSDVFEPIQSAGAAELSPSAERGVEYILGAVQSYARYWHEGRERFGANVEAVNILARIKRMLEDDARKLAAALAVPAAPVQAQTDPTEYQYRTRPNWRADGEGWEPWTKCSRESWEDYRKTPVLHDWEYQTRELYLHAPAAQPQPTPPAAPAAPVMTDAELVTLTGAQIVELLEAVNTGDGPDAETEITIIRKAEPFKSTDGEDMPAGLYFYWTEYPEEGISHLASMSADAQSKGEQHE